MQKYFTFSFAVQNSSTRNDCCFIGFNARRSAYKKEMYKSITGKYKQLHALAAIIEECSNLCDLLVS